MSADKDSLPTQVSGSLDWSRCVLCQDTSSEPLQCPFDTKRSDVDQGIGYQTLACNIVKFHEFGCLPMQLDLAQLDEGYGIEETLIQNRAKWHKSCRNKFSNLKLNRAEKKRKSAGDVQADTSNRSKITRRSCGVSTITTREICFFCGEASGDLHEAATFNMDQKVRKCARELQDTVLLAKLSAGDLISQEAVYHTRCLVSLYNRARGLKTDSNQDKVTERLQGIALAELVGYIEETRADSDVVPVFKLAELAKMYTSRLKQFGLDTSSRVHTTDLKNRILANIPGLEAHKKGRDVLLAFSEDIGLALHHACEYDFDDEAMILSKAANIVRRDMFAIKSAFNGTFENNCQQESVPQSLLALIGMILGGPNIQTQSINLVETQASLSISQLLQFNCTRRRREGSSSSYHTIEREPPLPIYLGLLVHAETRKRGLVDKLFDLGLSISYDRVLAISTEMGNSVCARFESEKVVCPPKLRHGIFTTSAVDNIDHNPSSTTAQGSLHGTGISLFQHPKSDFCGEDREVVVLDNTVSNKKNISPLPDAYTSVPPVILPRKEPAVPPTQGPLVSDCQLISTALDAEHRWLEHVKDEIEENDAQHMHVSWAAFHANRLPQDKSSPLDISSLLPLFQEQAKSAAMIRHSMDVVRKAVHFLNPGQVPVIACDQPLFSLAKQIQWTWPDSHGESHLVVMFGGLHIELAALKSIGQWLEDSGWTSALVQANIASSGTADSFLKASHMSRTRHAHQVTACALHILMCKAYQDYIHGLAGDITQLEFEIWKEQREAESPQFQYWSITLQFELAILIFVRSLREGNFQLYKDALTSMVPWFFALDHHNYARWLPVHVRDMMSLERMHPAVNTEFERGNFVVHKTQHIFSAIPIDQAHEQNNKCVKGDGGAVGLTENSSQLLRWMVSGPEMARVINEFEKSQELIKRTQSKGPDLRHHEQVKGVQTTFMKQLKALCDSIEEMGNPFLEQGEDLLVLDTNDIVDLRVAETIRQIQCLGKEQYAMFVDERLNKRTKPVSDPIKRNKLPLFSCPPVRSMSKEKQQISSLKQNCALFSQLYVSCQVRDGDLDDFFCHENHSFPPSLSHFGKLRSGSKSDLLVCLEKVSPPQYEAPIVDVLLLDGAAIVNMLQPGASKTFEEYAQQIFLPYLKRQLQDVDRVDIVWDEYVPDSLKATTRANRGKGIRRRVQPNTRLPGNWQAFLRVDENKTELFAYLAEQSVLINCEEHQHVISTKGTEVVCNSPLDTTRLSPCEHEEADTRLLLHVADAAKQGHRKLTVRTVDTDVLVLAIALRNKMNLNELWVALGTGKHLKYFPVHCISQLLGPAKSRGLLAFHAFTGCDQTSSFANRGKKTAWSAWEVFEQVTVAFEALSNIPTQETIEDVLPQLERFVVVMYDRASSCVGVNQARKELFTHKGRSIDAIPPTSEALRQHIKRSAYLAGHCWGQALVLAPQLPCPSNWGWIRGPTRMWEPFWTTLAQASESCQELLRCGCNVDKGCRGRCKCVKAEMLCTALCKCGGSCDRV